MTKYLTETGRRGFVITDLGVWVHYGGESMTQALTLQKTGNGNESRKGLVQGGAPEDTSSSSHLLLGPTPQISNTPILYSKSKSFNGLSLN